jgi:hypothetical protein
MKKVLLPQARYAQAAILFVASGLPLVGSAQVANEPSLQYTVKAADTLIVLAKDLLVRPEAWGEVARFNSMKNPNFISPGQKINMPLRLLKFQGVPGKVISTQGEVTVSGSPATVNAALAEGSNVQVGSNSSAVIELGDGSRVTLLPRTLAEVAKSRGYALRDSSASGSTTWFSGLIRLVQGSVDAAASPGVNRATPLQIETPTSLVGVRGTQFRVAYEDPASRNSRTEVTQGQVRTDNLAQKTGADLPRGTGAVVNPTQKEVKVVQLLPAPDLSGIPSELFKPQAALPMPVLAGANGYRVQVASDAQFEKIVRDIKVAALNPPAAVELGSLASSAWYARVRGIDAQGLEGFDSVKQVAVRDAKRLPWRVSSSTLSVRNYQTLLSWTAMAADGQPLPATRYTAQLASDPAFTQLLTSLESTGNKGELSLGPIQPGTYYIRLQASTPDGTSASENYRFELSNNWGVSVFDAMGALTQVK